MVLGKAPFEEGMVVACAKGGGGQHAAFMAQEVGGGGGRTRKFYCHQQVYLAEKCSERHALKNGRCPLPPSTQ